MASTMEALVTVFVGPVIHATAEDPLVVMESAALGVLCHKIVFLDHSSQLDKLREKYGFGDVIHLEKGEFLMPGLVDTHVHASQVPNAGTGLDLPLLEWLDKYTYPTEAMYADDAFAQVAYTTAVRRLLGCGTTTALYNATIHVQSTLTLFDICDQLGQRALVGKVCMDQESPEELTEPTQESVCNTRRYIEEAKKKNSSIVSPCIVPRFAIACSRELMTSLAELAKEQNVHIQSHLCESKAEIETVANLHSWAKNYTDVYDQCGLFDNQCSMAHCVYMEPAQMSVLKEKRTGVSHCPNSNMSLRSGLCDVRALLDYGIAVGLGTDVSGGYEPSMLDAMRLAFQTSNIVGMGKPGTYQHIDYKEAFRLATLGGSQVLGLEDKIGNFEVGKEFDALRVNTQVKDSPCDIFDKDTFLDSVQKFFYLGDDRNIVEVYVAGRRVVPGQQ